MGAILTVDAAIRDYIWATLQADATLLTGGPSGAALLAVDPTGALCGQGAALAVYPARLNDILAPVYPCITYRVASLTPVRAFEDAAAGCLTAPIDDCRIDLEIWAGVGSNTHVVSTVLGVLEQHFRNQTFAVDGGSVGNSPSNCFRCQQLTVQPDLFDNTQRSYFGLASYLFRVQRTIAGPPA